MQGVFEKVPDFEDVLRHAGGVAEPPPRPWTRLRNDPRVEAFIGATLEELHERNQKVEEARQIETQIRKTAAEQGIPVGQVRMGSMNATKVAEFAQSLHNTVDPGHDARKEEAEMDNRLAAIEHENKREQNRTVMVKDFNQNLAEAGSFEEALIAALSWGGEQTGRGFGGIVGMGISQRVNADPATAAAIAAAGAHTGGFMGKRAAMQAVESLRKNTPAPRREGFKRIQYGEAGSVVGPTGEIEILQP